MFGGSSHGVISWISELNSVPRLLPTTSEGNRDHERGEEITPFSVCRAGGFRRQAEYKHRCETEANTFAC